MHNVSFRWFLRIRWNIYKMEQKLFINIFIGPILQDDNKTPKNGCQEWQKTVSFSQFHANYKYKEDKGVDQQFPQNPAV